MSQKEKIGEVLIVLGIVAFAYYKYSKMSEHEKNEIHADFKETGKKIMKEFVPSQIQPFISTVIK